MSKGLWCAVLVAFSAAAQQDPKTSKENMIHDRGQTPVFRQTGTLSVKGMLFDAACKDRTLLNLAMPAETLVDHACGNNRRVAGSQ